MEDSEKEEITSAIKSSEELANHLMIEMEIRKTTIMVAVGAIAFLIIRLAEEFFTKQSDANAFDKVDQRMSSTVALLKQVATFIFDIALRQKAQADFEDVADELFDKDDDDD